MKYGLDELLCQSYIAILHSIVHRFCHDEATTLFDIVKRDTVYIKLEWQLEHLEEKLGT
jgi:hypothetical protein